MIALYTTRKLTVTTMMVAVSIFLKAQTSGSAIIDVNNFSSRFSSDGMISYDGSNANFMVPKDSGVQSVFAGNLWLAGFDNTFGVLHAAVPQYNMATSNIGCGPIADNYNSAYLSRYDKVWKLTKTEINDHIANYSNIGYTVPQTIADYPGNGNTANGEPAVLAPFADINGNLLYEPQLGEYPLIKGDMALYMIFSDRKTTGIHVSGTPLRVDIHLMVYGYNSFAGQDLNNTLFLHYRIINRSSNGYRDMLMGSWNDIDFGCFFNDLAGCDTLLHSYFVYNQGEDHDSGRPGYHNLRVSLGVTFLSSPLNAFAVYYNGGSVQTAEPAAPMEKYYAMDGLWSDGTQITYGGTGYGGSDTTNYMYSGDPCDTAAWNSTIGSDLRVLGSSGKFDLLPGGEICLDMAYVFATGDTQAACEYDEVVQLKNRIQTIRSFYSAHAPYCGSLPVVGVEEPGEDALLIFPNPSSDKLQIVFPSAAQRTISLIDINGREIQTRRTADLQTSIDLRTCAGGLYILRISEGNKQVYRKVMKL